jgi:hypothetical protein
MSSIPDSSREILRSYGYHPQNGRTMAMISKGISDASTTRTLMEGLTDSMQFSVNRKLRALSFLWMSETQARNTSTEVGSIQLNYWDGSRQQVPLIVGKNLDASWKFFAAETEPVLLHDEDYAKTYTISCDNGKELQSFTIRLRAADVQIGLLGVNMILPEADRTPLVGAIRWDGWFYDTSNFITRILQKTLAPKEFHKRLPFFAKEISDDSVYVNGSSQEIMDQEIAYAKAGGLDYWAFVTYPPADGLSIGLRNYLKSKHRGDIHFSIITEQGRLNPSDTGYLDYIRKLMEEPGYQMVENGRPLWFVGFIDSANVRNTWGSFRQLKKGLDSIRLLIQGSGGKNPYLVIMDFNAELGKRWADSLGGDAISSYVAQKNSVKGTYQQLNREVEQFWEECKSTGAQVVPICDAGWSPKPRLDYPNIWTHFYPKGNYYADASPSELASHVRRALDWMKEHPASAPARCILIYAWNEYDEGGWLGPTLFEGTKRLDALRSVIREFKNQKQ